MADYAVIVLELIGITIIPKTGSDQVTKIGKDQRDAGLCWLHGCYMTSIGPPKAVTGGNVPVYFSKSTRQVLAEVACASSEDGMS